MRYSWLPLMLTACGVSPDAIRGNGAAVRCDEETYPSGATEPMTVGEVLTPYRWSEAFDRARGARVPLDLATVPCNIDPNLDWSPADVLLFVSIPAW